MSVKATLLVKTLDGKYIHVAFEDIEQVFINYLGEKMVFFKGGYGIQVDAKDGSATETLKNLEEVTTKPIKERRIK